MRHFLLVRVDSRTRSIACAALAFVVACGGPDSDGPALDEEPGESAQDPLDAGATNAPPPTRDAASDAAGFEAGAAVVDGGTRGRRDAAPGDRTPDDAAAAAAADAASGPRDAGTSDSGSSGECDWSEPPADIAAWVNESWNAQLGQNIRSRKAWNLDNVMLNQGSMNLCVRWGATTAVPEAIRTDLAATVERWFNDWFKGLGSYGCFPYADGIKVKVTGWAVKPGREALLAGIDPAIPVYTETDSSGEPKCPDACSSFVHWDHQFPGCPGGEANHSDYWLWFNDDLPGGGGAAAVGGDWGLRMPIRTFLNAFDKPSDSIVEHEMGHGFGIQDYYEWTGSRPRGGSIMIVGSSRSQAPTEADIWLLRRTWKEMKTLRGW